MADALPYRPPTAVEDEEEEEKLKELKKPDSDSLKLTIRKPDLFMKAMTLWYLYMTPRDKAKLTKKILMKRAEYEAGLLHMKMNSLPKNWIKTLQTEEMLELFVKKSTLERRKRKREEREQLRAKKIFTEDFNVTKEERNNVETDAVLRDELKRITEKHENEDGSPKSKFKKWIDLTHEVPPEGWLDSLRDGIISPRIQAVHSTSEANYLYWDYNIEHWKPVEETTGKSPSEMVVYAHQGNRFHWFRKQAMEENTEKEALAEQYGLKTREISFMAQDRDWNDKALAFRESSTSTKNSGVKTATSGTERMEEVDFDDEAVERASNEQVEGSGLTSDAANDDKVTSTVEEGEITDDNEFETASDHEKVKRSISAPKKVVFSENNKIIT